MGASYSTFPPSGKTGGKFQNAIIDWLDFTYIPKNLEDDIEIANLRDYLTTIFGCPISLEPRHRQFRRFDRSWTVRAHHSIDQVTDVAIFASGDARVDFRNILSITGHGCSIVKKWEVMYCMLQDKDARITRVDIAIDIMDKSITYEQIVDLYDAGGFNTAGNTPLCYEHKSGKRGDRSSHGRTFEIGKRKNGKMVRCYEKGKQLGLHELMHWIRIELELRAKDRTIPHEVLIHTNQYFAGAHKALAQFVKEASEIIKTHRAKSNSDVKKSIENIKRTYGKHINQLLETHFESVDEFIKSVRVLAVPKKLYSTVVVEAMHGEHDKSPPHSTHPKEI